MQRVTEMCRRLRNISEMASFGPATPTSISNSLTQMNQLLVSFSQEIQQKMAVQSANDVNEDNGFEIIGDNVNDGTICILSDNINIKFCPKCKAKVSRTDEDISMSCAVMICKEKECANDWTYWCWECHSIINMTDLSFSVTDEPRGACKQCRKLSRKKRNKCKNPNYRG